ncbi:MAG: hypothetical protein KDK78_02605, partial [Chlamydiia bacterium]|nr:hypothetical protein [Chlamydiia bacterium]
AKGEALAPQVIFSGVQVNSPSKSLGTAVARSLRDTQIQEARIANSHDPVAAKKAIEDERDAYLGQLHTMSATQDVSRWPGSLFIQSNTPYQRSRPSADPNPENRSLDCMRLYASIAELCGEEGRFPISISRPESSIPIDEQGKRLTLTDLGDAEAYLTKQAFGSTAALLESRFLRVLAAQSQANDAPIHKSILDMVSKSVVDFQGGVREEWIALLNMRTVPQSTVIRQLETGDVQITKHYLTQTNPAAIAEDVIPPIDGGERNLVQVRSLATITVKKDGSVDKKVHFKLEHRPDADQAFIKKVQRRLDEANEAPPKQIFDSFKANRS